MRIIKDVKKAELYKGEKFAVTIGNFDGLHKAHTFLLEQCVAAAKKRGCSVLAVTFIKPEHMTSGYSPKKLLTTFEHKCLLMKRMGVDCCLALELNEELVSTGAEEFAERYLFDAFDISYLTVGYNFRFGRGREGDTLLLQDLAEDRGIEFQVEEPLYELGSPVSSTRIRALVSGGVLGEVKELLGRGYSVFGKVCKGKGRGRTLGSPTVNLDTDIEVLPPCGVYAARIRMCSFEFEVVDEGVIQLRAAKCGCDLPAVLNLGFVPTFESYTEPLLEAHLIDFSGDLYGEYLEIEFVSYIRDENKFNCREELMEQISLDIEEAKRVLSALK